MFYKTKRKKLEEVEWKLDRRPEIQPWQKLPRWDWGFHSNFLIGFENYYYDGNHYTLHLMFFSICYSY